MSLHRGISTIGPCFGPSFWSHVMKSGESHLSRDGPDYVLCLQTREDGAKEVLRQLCALRIQGFTGTVWDHCVSHNSLPTAAHGMQCSPEWIQKWYETKWTMVPPLWLYPSTSHMQLLLEVTYSGPTQCLSRGNYLFTAPVGHWSRGYNPFLCFWCLVYIRKLGPE